MEKAHVNLSISTDLANKAKQTGINMSALLEDSIEKKLQIVKINIDSSIDKCQFCGNEEPKATAKEPVGLRWLWPDEKWICNSCLKRKYISVPIAGK